MSYKWIYSEDLEDKAVEEKLVKQLEIGENPEMVRNPYSGIVVTLCPEAVALYDYIKGCELLDEDFEVGLILFRTNWFDEYMKLLD
jgi:hypothetical protein